MLQRIKHKLYFLSDNSTTTSIATSPYQFSAIGTEILYANTVSLASQMSPTFTTTNLNNVTSVTPIRTVLTTNNTLNTLSFVVEVLPTVGNTICGFNITLQNRNTINGNKTDIFGTLNGYLKSNNTFISGMTCFASTSNSQAILQFTSHSNAIHILQGEIYYISN